MAFSQAVSELLLLQVHHAHDVGSVMFASSSAEEIVGGLTRTSGNRDPPQRDRSEESTGRPGERGNMACQPV